MPFTPPKPASRPENASLWTRLRLARRDIFASQPAKLYRAWMAEQGALIYRSFLINQPELLKTILKDRPDDFPKSGIIADTLKPLLGNSVFVTNGETWKRQRRIIDPAFEGGRLRDTFPAMVAAGKEAIQRLTPRIGEEIEIEYETSHAAADVIFRTLFSIPITDATARSVFDAFRAYQRAQPLLSFVSLIRAPKWIPRLRLGKGRAEAATIRRLLVELTTARAAEIEAGTAPDDLATKIMTFLDPETGDRFDTAEMVDQVAIFFLAGHETSASALAWTLYLLACDEEVQNRAATEAATAWDDSPDFSSLRNLPFTRDVFREALRLYPPVPMMVREATRPEHFRDRDVPAGSLCILSPWHLHRHERLWPDPDLFDPDRWSRDETGPLSRDAYMPFSTGPRVCTGAGFAMAEGTLLLAMLLRAFRFEAIPDKVPKPVTHLTVRSESGIFLKLDRRDPTTKLTQK